MGEMEGAGFVARRRKSCFIHEFTKTPPGIVCPHFFVLSHGNGCPYSCDYCYLQLTFRYNRGPVVFSNREDLLRDVRRFLDRPKAAVLNAGELSDGLAYDRVTGLSTDLVPLFADQDRHKLLFLTKSVNVGNLLKTRPTRNVIVSFSLNAPGTADRFEHAAPPPFERIEAARECQRVGYDVRIRVDPMIPVPCWREDYGRLIDRVCERLDPEGLRVTVGSVRYFRSLPGYAGRRGRSTAVFHFAPGPDGADGRMRVPRDQRMEMYAWLRGQVPASAEVSLCKETEVLWDELGWRREPARCNCAL